MTLVGAFASQLGVPSFIAKMVEKGPVAEKRRECCLSLLGADASSEDLRENPTLRKRGTSRAKHVDSHTGHEYRWTHPLCQAPLQAHPKGRRVSVRSQCAA